jgi:hypothetical protein
MTRQGIADLLWLIAALVGLPDKVVPVGEVIHAVCGLRQLQLTRA